MSQSTGIVTTTEDARAVVEDIARRKGTFTVEFWREAEAEARNGRKGMLQAIEGSEEIRNDLAKALKLISTDLYTSRARFLMEIIQNADDNTYTEGEIPTISITVAPKHVKIECNERGFSKENIQALCRTGRSSKTPGQGYTGEKGIGFKSVFKLANRAHIRSPPYYFQLDQTRELGMITPQWDEDFFGDHYREHQTTIVLDHICDKSTDFVRALENDVDAIDPVLILFLRRIERFDLAIWKYSSDVKPAISKRFRCIDWTPDSGIVSVKDENGIGMRRWYKHRFTTSFNGLEPLRPGITRTDVTLAFRVTKRTGTFAPVILNRNLVYAYLPLGDFGFKFIIQADFLTTSNRQSVDEDSQWNKNIARAIPYALQSAIDKLNYNGGNSDLNNLAKTWPLYLDHGASGLSAYWMKIKSDILMHLHSAPIIKDRTGSVGEPERLMFLDWAHDRDGEPMFGNPYDYVCSSYPDSVRKALLTLGVSTPNWFWVCDKLWQLHNANLLDVRMRSKEWCSDLAKIILEPQEPSGTGKYARDLRMIPLIPLADGTWRNAPAENDPVYFPASLGTTIPPGLRLTLVDEEACACPKRRRLFQLLGVKDCDVPNVIERILDHHAKFSSAKDIDIIAQLRYLYKMRDYLRPGDMAKICFVCRAGTHFYRGVSTYADISVGDKLQQLFSGYSKANFLDNRYYAGLNVSEQVEFVAWLGTAASVALAPRLIGNLPNGLHTDFGWLLANRGDDVLAILAQHWNLYNKSVTNPVLRILAGHKSMCKSGRRAALRDTYLPLPKLIEMAQVFGDANGCHFLALPTGDPKDWKFLSSVGVGLDNGLDFHLWVLNQSGFRTQTDVEKAKKLYLAIQSRVYYPAEEQKVIKAFDGAVVSLSSTTRQYLSLCAWHGPKGFRSKPALSSVYGNELERLFRTILRVPNATIADALHYLESLRVNRSTTMADVIQVYLFLQTYHADTSSNNDNIACIAIPSLLGPALEWKTPAQCVWDDSEFSQNELELESKTSICHLIKKHAPASKAFFINFLRLRNADIIELLADLALMEKEKRDDPKRVHRLYERIAGYRHSRSTLIKQAFRVRPLVFLRGINGQRGQWLRLEDCVWTRSVLRYKRSLIPSLDQYRGLFRDTLGVPNATMDMLLTDLLGSLPNALTENDTYQYVRELLPEIARLRQKHEKLERLDDKKCWPCRTPTCSRELCSIGDFYVNDRQDLFELFSGSHTFLDFDFKTLNKVADLLRIRGCDFFLSEKVVISTESGGPLEHDHDLTHGFRCRANALVKYLEHAGCKSSHRIRPLLENVEVWSAADIRTHYTLENTTVTKHEGGSSVKVNTGEDGNAKLEVYVSADMSMRKYALMIDLPEQLVAALGLEPPQALDLAHLLQVPLQSLQDLLIKKGIIGGDAADDFEMPLVRDSVNKHSRSQSDRTDEHDGAELSMMSVSSVRLDSLGPAIVETTRVSARSEAAYTNLRPHEQGRLIYEFSTSESESRNSRDASSEEGRERPVTPRPTAAGLYSTDSRLRNRDRIQSFARDADPVSTARTGKPRSQSGGGAGAFDMHALRETLQAASCAPPVTAIQVNPSPRRRVGQISIRNEEEMARDVEIGFWGEQFVYTLLHDTLNLPNFTGEGNWTSSLRSRAGFSTYGREVSDFTYKDTQGALTRHFLNMQHPYAVPEWLSTICNNDNAPNYLLEVKSTTSQDPTTTFYMSGRQHKLAKRLRVTSATPSEVYVVLRISGLDALEDMAEHRPQWRAYLDPYTRGEEGVLNFVAPTYAVTASR